MTALFRNSNVRIGIITILLTLFSLIIIAPAIVSAQAYPEPAGVRAAAIRPATTDSGSILTSIGQFIGNLILSIASMVTWAGGKLLELSIDKFILNLGTLINGSIGVTINSLWTVIRDMANLAFIFGFIYIGIMTIIDSSSANTKRMLASIIIGALLINFSLFFTKIIIDVSNYIAVEIYNSLITNTGGQTGSISAKFADILGITTFYEFQNADQYAKTTAWGNVAFYFMGAIMLIVAGFVFAAGAILLLTRFVALVFIMIFSPLLFAATVFPQTQSMASDLWKKLINYSFFAPAYLILLIVSLKILESVVTVFKKGSLVNALNGGGGGTPPADFFDVILNFVIAILFLIMSLQIAQKFGVAGANKVMSVGNSLRGKAQSAVGRNTVGRFGTAVNKWQDDARKSDSGARRWAARATRWSGANAAASAASESTWGGKTSHKSQKAEREDVDRGRAKSAQVAEISRKINDSVSTERNPSATTAQKETARMEMENAIAGASTEQLQKLLEKHKKGSDEYREIVSNMSSNQFDNLMKLKPEDLDDKKKAELGAERAKAVEQRLLDKENRKNAAGVPPGGAAPAPATVQDVIGKADGKDLDALDFNTVYNNAGRLTSKQIDDMSLTPTAKSRLKAKRESDLVAEFSTMAGPITIFKRFNDAEAAKLPRGILADPKAAPFINVNMLTKILDNDSIKESDRSDIKTNINTHHSRLPSAATFTNFFNSPLGQRYT